MYFVGDCIFTGSKQPLAISSVLHFSLKRKEHSYAMNFSDYAHFQIVQLQLCFADP